MRAPQYDGGPTKATAEVNQSWFALAIGQISYAPRVVVQRRSGRCLAASHADCKPPPTPKSLFSFGPAMLLCMGWFFLVLPLDLAAKSHEIPVCLGLASFGMAVAHSSARLWVPKVPRSVAAVYEVFQSREMGMAVEHAAWVSDADRNLAKFSGTPSRMEVLLRGRRTTL